MDRKNNEGVSSAIWIPFIWMFFARSRNISEWLNLSTPDMSMSSDAVLEGDPFNRAVYTILIIAGVIILRQRKIDWKPFFTKNAWIWLYFAFGTLSFFWSDYPYVSFKRWFKALGLVIMVLIILTEERPYVTIGVILKRLSFLLLPLSVLFIKYYPHLGRVYHMGKPLFTGVGTTKNSLGNLCLTSGIYFSWNLLFGRRNENEASQRLHYSIYLIMLTMNAWLFCKADSATSFVCMLVAICLFAVGQHPAIAGKPGRILNFIFACLLLFGIMELAFGFKDTVITMLGRRPDLTTRVPMWEDLLSMVKNPLIGCGYESFWLGDRRHYMTVNWGISNQAHNGYLEMYLNLGVIGVFFIVCWIVSGIINVNRQFAIDYPAAMLRLCFIVVVALYNYTEAVFYGVNSLWMLFFIGIMYCPGQLDLLLKGGARKKPRN
jgi:O-antigen ligase